MAIVLRPIQFFLASLLAFSPSMAAASTWHVTPGGSGGSLTLLAAMDSAAVLDTVLVAPGEYVIGPIQVADGIVLVSEEGPLKTRIVEYPGAAGGLGCTSLNIRTEIRGFWFDGFDGYANEELGAINILDCVDVRIIGCLFTENDYAGISVDTEASLRIEKCTFVNNVVAVEIVNATGTFQHNIFWGPVHGMSDLIVVVCNDFANINDAPPVFRVANFSSDPSFCSATDYRVMPSSPCAPGQSPLGTNCGLIGALPADCSTTPVESRTWGGVKAIYRQQ
ncbi:MAG TPA: right-handed parallel beta-helix repeat-containing protein [Candidatus Krumholzibacteria bacterium]|nr:right-handed parallel beta-helix repeat-containing protein [Candidatus Krumholzibacteria bacterium]